MTVQSNAARTARYKHARRKSAARGDKHYATTVAENEKPDLRASWCQNCHSTSKQDSSFQGRAFFHGNKRGGPAAQEG